MEPPPIKIAQQGVPFGIESSSRRISRNLAKHPPKDLGFASRFELVSQTNPPSGVCESARFSYGRWKLEFRSPPWASGPCEKQRGHENSQAMVAALSRMKLPPPLKMDPPPFVKPI